MSILKTITYGILFLVLQPGFLFNLYPGENGIFLSNETSYISIFLHTFLLAIILSIFEERRSLDPPKDIMTQLTKIETRELFSIVYVLLFVLLSPGLLITLPAEGDKTFLSLETNKMAVLIHCLIFIFSFGFIVNIVDKYKELLKLI